MVCVEKELAAAIVQLDEFNKKKDAPIPPTNKGVTNSRNRKGGILNVSESPTLTSNEALSTPSNDTHILSKPPLLSSASSARNNGASNAETNSYEDVTMTISGLGLSLSIPPYLRYQGSLNLRHMLKSETEK